MNPKLESAVQVLTLLELGAVLVLSGVGLVSAVVFLRVLAPRLAAEAEAVALRRSVGLRFLLGLVNLLLLLFLAAILLGRSGWKPIGLLVLLALAFLVLTGLAGELPRLGRRALDRANAPALQATLTGGAILTATLLLPLVGQLFVLVLLVLATGTGVSWVVTRGGSGS